LAASVRLKWDGRAETSSSRLEEALPPRFLGLSFGVNASVCEAGFAGKESHEILAVASADPFPEVCGFSPWPEVTAADLTNRFETLRNAESLEKRSS